MTTLVESESTLKLSVAIREYEDNEEQRQPSAKLALIVPPRGRSSRTCSSRISTSMHTKATTPPHRQRVHANYRQRRTPIFYHSCKRISRQLDCTRGKRFQPEKLPHPVPSTTYMPIGDTEESQYTVVPAMESYACMIPLVRSEYRLRISAAVDQIISRPPVIDPGDKEVSGNRPKYINRKLPPLLSASMTTLVESGSTLKLSVAIRVYEDNEEKRKSSAQLDLTAPPKEEVEEPVAVASAHLCTQKLPHPVSVNELHANWRHGGKPIYYRYCKGILCLNDSTREKRVQAEVFSDHQDKEVSRIRPNFVNEKLPHIISVNERQANWRHGRKPIYCRSCKGILCLHDSSREKRVQGENFGSS
ncbi:hypothetical protein J6590_082126 [Homalodisca vitripennis]|nr:hypothetical protein J6590_082126 [Homalodisca vitripennis]